MLRLYDPTEGTILVNGQDIKTFKLADLRESMAVLFQDYTHFPLTVSYPSPKHHPVGWPLTRGLVLDRSKITSRLGTLRMHTMKPGSERRRG
jgi:ABC-type oligopeptide transport system ATPase subunit